MVVYFHINYSFFIIIVVVFNTPKNTLQKNHIKKTCK